VKAGSDISIDSKDLSSFNIEISPLFGDNEHDFLSKLNDLKPCPMIYSGGCLG